MLFLLLNRATIEAINGTDDQMLSISKVNNDVDNNVDVNNNVDHQKVYWQTLF